MAKNKVMLCCIIKLHYKKWYLTFTLNHLADAFKRLNNEHNGSNQIQQKSNEVLWQVSVSLTQYTEQGFCVNYIRDKKNTDRIEKDWVLEVFFNLLLLV